ncbi:MAG: peptidoglycan-binding protein [Microcystis sp.]|uniref:peptidoglycan-binding protein n=1 Tax=Microcystis sp. TaxID=1127 RepID=UPI00391F7F1C
MSDSILIKEFSRKLLEPKRQGDRWVSSGFDKEIGLRTHENPPTPIQNAVHNHWFRINDSYPPAEGKIALIAREIDRYAVLAVASPLKDDCDRPLVGYRYFWLEKPLDGEIDAVGTLLEWWVERNSPRFELKLYSEIRHIQQQNRGQGYYSAILHSPHDFDKVRQFEQLALEVQQTPHIFTPSNSFIPSYWHLHFFSRYLKQKYNRPIAWAWKVTVLESPNQFTLIACTTQEYCQINSDANKIPTALTPHKTGQDILDTSPVQVQSIQSLKRALKELSEGKEIDQNLNILVQELEKTDSTRWDWATLIDSTWLEQRQHTQQEKIYKSLILLLNPNLQHTDLTITVSDWLNSLQAPVSPAPQKLLDFSRFLPSALLTHFQPSELPVTQEAKEALDRQHQLIQLYSRNSAILAKNKTRLHQLIARLFLLLRSNLSPKSEEVIQWLLIDYSPLWKESLEIYTNDLFRKLDRAYLKKEQLPPQESDKFIEKILEDLKQCEQGQTAENPSSYESIAGILEKNKSYPIAAFFYKLATGKVPDKIWENCTNLPEIIPLERPPAIPPQSSEKSPNSLKKIALILWQKYPWQCLGLSVAVGTVLGVGVLWGVQSIGRVFSPKISAPVRELYLYFNLLESSDRRQDLQAKNLDNLKKLREKMPDFNASQWKTSTQREAWLEERSSIIKDPLYPFLQKLTPAVRVELNKTYTANQVTANPPLNAPEIALGKSLLHSLQLYEGEITPIWDQKVSDAIAKFKTQYQIQPAGGDLDKNTWSILAPMIQDRQIKTAINTLERILKESENYSIALPRYKAFQQCKTQTNTAYSACLDQIFKPDK